MGVRKELFMQKKRVKKIISKCEGSGAMPTHGKQKKNTKRREVVMDVYKIMFKFIW